jgi:hypothetical protein
MKPQPLVCVRDVEACSRWYQRLLNLESDHGGPNHWECWLRDPEGYAVVLASHHEFTSLLVHGLLFTFALWILFRPAASAYFRSR